MEIPFFTAAYLFFSHLDMLNGMNWWIIKDLALPDGLLKINNVTINILPILMTIFNVISCEIYMKGFKFKEKVQIYALAFVFLIILYNSPSGLVLYWTFNNLISLIRSVIMKLKKSVIYLNFVLLFIVILVFLKIPSYRTPFLLIDFFMFTEKELHYGLCKLQNPSPVRQESQIAYRAVLAVPHQLLPRLAFVHEESLRRRARRNQGKVQYQIKIPSADCF